MRKSLSSLGLLLCCVLYPVKALATPGWSGLLTIMSVIPVDTTFTIIVSGNNNPAGCPTNNGWLRLHVGDANYSVIVSAILTAFAQGKQIKTWQVDCESDGSIHFTAAWIDR